jgi:exodeoxyribonuclease V alpha subunit
MNEENKMSIIMQKDIIFKCSVDAILHPTKEEEIKRQDKTAEMWTMFRTYIKRGTHYEPRICVGMAPPVAEGDELTLMGDLVDTGKYGLQFQFSGIQKQLPTERNAVVAFLVKNVNGVGPTIAEKIVDVLGTNVVEKVRQDPAVLESISGISAARASNIKSQLDAMESSLEELQFWAKTGLGNSRVLTVKSTYEEMRKENARKIDIIDLIKRNPYQLITDVKGIGFRVADSVALNIGFPKDDPKRIAAGLEFTLKEDVDAKGNIWTDKDTLLSAASGKTCLNLSTVTVLPILEKMIVDKKLIEENGRVYLPHYYELEFAISEKIKAIQSYQHAPVSDSQIEHGIKRAERVKERELDDGQRAAVKTCIENNFSIVTGGPGVGKTTTLDILLYFLEHECNMNITMAAPTGRAAKRMTEQTGRNASTIHSLSGQKTQEDFTEGDQRQVLVIDESSMVDISVMKMALDLCDVSTKVIFVGDVDQLPSIGPGQILRDMIESGVIATARLTKIHRQSADSHIITNAHLCINGKHLEKDGTVDFFITERFDEAECLKAIKSYIVNAYPNKLGVPSSDVQVLAPLRRGVLGVNNLNKVLQEAINPPDSSKQEIEMKLSDDAMILREGDRVIQNKNDYNIRCNDGSKGIFNGEIGKIKKIINNFGEILIVVAYPDKEAIYELSAAKNLTLAYAITIHKSQGSEFKAVVLPLFSYGMPTIYNRNLLYTAITRAKSYCCIVGKRETVNKMIHNNKVNKRRTTLTIRLNGESDECLKTKTKKKKGSTKSTTKAKSTATSAKNSKAAAHSSKTSATE